MCSFVSVRIEPVDAQKYAGHTAEATRRKIPSYVDHDKLDKNVTTKPEISADELRTYISDLRARTGQQKLRKDARLAFSGIITFSHEAQPIFDALAKHKQLELYKEICDEIAKKHNTSVLSMSLHADETAPHAHFMICAYDKTGKALRLNPKDTSDLQDIAGEVLQRHNIAITRGKKITQRIAEAAENGEEANIKHKSVAELHSTMATDLKKAKEKTMKTEKKTKKLLDFAVLKKMPFSTFLEKFGYFLNKKESSILTKKYENDQDTIIVKQSSSGDYIYFNAKNESDCGTIIDFCKNRNIDLRTLTSPAPAQAPAPAPSPAATAVDMTETFSALAMYDLPYLTKRGIEPALIQKFNVRKDSRGNACFAHSAFESIYKSAREITGWEVKNEGFTGFSKNGNRNIGIARLGDSIESIVICESFIDCMSYAQLKRAENTVFLSTGGTLTEKQIEQISAIASAYSEARVVIATDADAPGDQYAQRLGLALASAERERPEIGKDWNDDLIDSVKGQIRRAGASVGPR